MSDLLELADYRRRVEELYASVRARGGREGWELWRATRDELAGRHSQGVVPAADREVFTGFDYYAYDPALCTLGELVGTESRSVGAPRSAGGEMAFFAIGTLHFELRGETHSLELMWLDAYGGGLFLPFRDATCGETTYGGGRYLLDGAKGADLGAHGDRLILDFNFAYHPSCAHDPQWSCPLAPPGNRLDIAIEGGERLSRG